MTTFSVLRPSNWIRGHLQMRLHPQSILCFYIHLLPPSTFHTLHHSSWPAEVGGGTQSLWSIYPTLGINPSSSTAVVAWLLNHWHAFVHSAKGATHSSYLYLIFLHLLLCISLSGLVSKSLLWRMGGVMGGWGSDGDDAEEKDTLSPPCRAVLLIRRK